MTSDNEGERDQRILKRMADALALAERGVGGEAENALALFQRLRTRHQIDLDTVRQFRDKKQAVQRPTMEQIDVGTKGDRGGGAYVELFKAIAAQNRLRTVYATGGAWIQLFGFPSDIKATKDIYRVAVVHMIADAEEYLDGDEWRDGKVDKRQARRSFYNGFIDAIERRLKHERLEAEREAAKEWGKQGLDTALVIRDKVSEVNGYFREQTRGESIRWSRSSGRGRSASQTAKKAGDRSGTNARLFGAESLGGARPQVER